MTLQHLINARRRRRLARSTKRLDLILKEWTRDPGDSYVGIALQYASLRPWEAAALAYLRQGDAGQIAAVNILQAARNARWTKWATLVAAFSVPANVALTAWLR